MGREWMPVDCSMHAHGPSTAKDRSPNVVLVGGSSSLVVDDDGLRPDRPRQISHQPGIVRSMPKSVAGPVASEVKWSIPLSTSFVRWQMSRLLSDYVSTRLYHWSSAAPDYLPLATELFRSLLLVSGTVCLNTSPLHLPWLFSSSVSKSICFRSR